MRRIIWIGKSAVLMTVRGVVGAGRRYEKDETAAADGQRSPKVARKISTEFEEE